MKNSGVKVLKQSSRKSFPGKKAKPLEPTLCFSITIADIGSCMVTACRCCIPSEVLVMLFIIAREKELKCRSWHNRDA